ncbi:MAG: hypothetical protein QW569_03595 [Candidatus Bathyarchaeia archaeon]|nr:hypothetical protein [Candidatus Bathyarchaeota archaeon]
MADCIYGLMDVSNKVFNCRALDQIGKLLRAEDQPKFCEHCPMRLHAIRFIYASSEEHAHRETG